MIIRHGRCKEKVVREEQTFRDDSGVWGSCYIPILQGLVWRGAGWEGKITSELGS